MASKRPPNEVVQLPDGTEVCYWSEIGVDGKRQQRRYTVGGERCVSISTVAGVLDRPQLMHAAVKLQEQGIIDLAKAGVDVAGETQESLRALLKRTGLHFDSVWEVARRRGDMAHDMLLKILGGRKMVSLSEYPEDIRPWLQGGFRFLSDFDLETEDCEYMVGDPVRRVAGRGDWFGRTTLTSGRKGWVRIDWKTVSKWHYKRNGEKSDCYDENKIQISGYESTGRGCGYRPADELWVVQLGPDGTYHRTVVPYRPDIFELALNLYRAKL